MDVIFRNVDVTIVLLVVQEHMVVKYNCFAILAVPIPLLNEKCHSLG